MCGGGGDVAVHASHPKLGHGKPIECSDEDATAFHPSHESRLEKPGAEKAWDNCDLPVADPSSQRPRLLLLDIIEMYGLMISILADLKPRLKRAYLLALLGCVISARQFLELRRLLSVRMSGLSR